MRETDSLPCVFLQVIVLTVVRIHMRATTLAPMATAPAVPPRTALFADLFIMSRKDGGGGDSSVFVVTAVDVMISCWMLEAEMNLPEERRYYSTRARWTNTA